MSLADPRTIRYVTKRITSGSLPDAVITDGTHNQMGKITAASLIDNKIQLLDNHYSLLIESEIKETSTGRIYLIRDSEQNFLGTVKITKHSRNLNSWMQNSIGTIILAGEGPDIGPFRIKDESGKIIASISTNAKNLEELVKVGQSIVLQVNELSFDRMSLLGYFISLYSNFNDELGQELSPRSALKPY